ncbi:LysR family transcriptional regulator [Gracilibacillus alcaliphilus]|uniref:LysR family transcriptional regulator n=1 Tax=Gracilibacillus alcaliphilus TaxID=1401441 RepID=UPI00195AC3E3|nr:LysR family transcriptional regulator [Gracilibacillus alcaliphilus]MBM7676724.1 DNA-binding transcriptional LysR family regulator [Gracilibacillus alcaliphilus]
MELNLHQLRIFYVLAKEKTTYNAAKQLRISQPSVSSQIKQFEKTIGVSLFKKQGRNIVLTDFGSLLLKYAEDLFNIEKDIIFEINKFRGKTILHITGHQLAIEQLINPMIKKFKRHQEDTDVTVAIKSTKESISLLQKDQIDLAIIGLNPNLIYDLDEKTYSKVQLLNDRFCFVVNSNFGIHTTITKTELSNLSFVGRLQNSYSQSLLDLFMEKHIMNNLQFDLRFENASSALEYALSNNVVYFSSYSLVKEYINQSMLKELHIIDNDSFSLNHEIYAVHKKKNLSSLLIKKFLAHSS